jgi:hypothetical protein
MRKDGCASCDLYFRWPALFVKPKSQVPNAVANRNGVRTQRTRVTWHSAPISVWARPARVATATSTRSGCPIIGRGIGIESCDGVKPREAVTMPALMSVCGRVGSHPRHATR